MDNNGKEFLFSHSLYMYLLIQKMSLVLVGGLFFFSNLNMYFFFIFYIPCSILVTSGFLGFHLPLHVALGCVLPSSKYTSKPVCMTRSCFTFSVSTLDNG